MINTRQTNHPAPSFASFDGAQNQSPGAENYGSTSPSANNRAQSGGRGAEEDLDGWDMVNIPSPAQSRLHPPRSPLTPRSSSLQHPQHPSRVVGPFAKSSDESVHLNAAEVLEHISGNLSSDGWGDHIVRQALAESASNNLQPPGETASSMRSWTGSKKKRGAVRPLSHQPPPIQPAPSGAIPPTPVTSTKEELISRQVSNASGSTVDSKKSLGYVPAVPPRHASRIPPPPLNEAAGIRKSLRMRRMEKRQREQGTGGHGTTEKVGSAGS
jgi:hypothetical protein